MSLHPAPAKALYVKAQGVVDPAAPVNKVALAPILSSGDFISIPFPVSAATCQSVGIVYVKYCPRYTAKAGRVNVKVVGAGTGACEFAGPGVDELLFPDVDGESLEDGLEL